MSVEIPTVSEVNKRIEEWRKSSQECECGEKRIREEQEVCDLYKHHLYDCIKKAIERCTQTNCIDLGEDVLEIMFNASSGRMYYAHIIHYGRYHNVFEIWEIREPFSQTRNVFREVQRELYKKGWYLLDETDLSLDLRIKFVLYGRRPIDYGMKKLWHGLDVLPDDIDM